MLYWHVPDTEVLLLFKNVHVNNTKTSSSAMPGRPCKLDQRFQGGQFEAKL